jgi:hypothetical protein
MEKDKVMKLAKKHWAKPPSASAEKPVAPPAAKAKSPAKKKAKGKAAKAEAEAEAEAEVKEDGAGDDDEVMTGFSQELVEKLYKEELGGGDPAVLARVVVLELSQYLENYLWPHFDAATATKAHLMSIVALVNEKFREGVPAWACFHAIHPVRHPPSPAPPDIVPTTRRQGSGAVHAVTGKELQLPASSESS